MTYPQVTTSRAQSHFLLNVASNFVMLIVNAFVGFWFTRFIIEHLGVALAGLVPLATSITAYMTILTVATNSAISRYLTIDLAREDFNEANRTFNTALVASILSVIILIPIGIYFVFFSPYLFNIPVGQEHAVQWLFFATITAFLIGAIESSFAVSSFALGRFDLRNSISIVSLLARVGFIGLAFYLIAPTLWQVGFGIIVGAVFSLTGSVWVWRRLTPQLSISPKVFDRTRLLQLSGMAGWMIINQVGALLFLQIDLIVVNTFFGAELAGRYSPVLQWSFFLRSIAGTISGALTPIILGKYAKGDFKAMALMSRHAVKLLGITMALPVGLLCGFSQPFLTLWLGPIFQDSALLLIVLLAHLPVNLAVLPLFANQVAFNKVRWPGIVTLLMGVLNVALAVLLANWGSWGTMGVAVAGAVVLTLKNAFFTPIYVSRIQKLPWWTFLPSIIYAVVATIGITSITLILQQYWPLTDWVSIFFTSIVVTTLYAFVMFFFGFTNTEKRLICSLLANIKLRISLDKPN